MRNPFPFDTHAYIKRLIAAGVPEAQAAVHASIFADAVVERLATKEDLQQLRQELRVDFKDVELRLTLRGGAMLAAANAIVVALVKLL